MSIITDNSTPLPLNSPQNLQMINTVNTNMQSFINSNMLSNVSNLLINNINTKQPILTAATNLLGVGSAITAIDWTKITLNKPTDFQANWNTTVINKPTDFQANWNTTVINKPSTFPADMTNIYSKTETNGLLDAKQATLTAATTLLGTGGSITALDYNKITVNKPTNFQSDYITTVINKPTYVSPLSSNLATNQISVNLSSYSTTGSDANYVLKSGSTMTGTLTAPIINATSTTTASDFKGIYIMHASRQSHLPYLPNGQFYFRAPVIIDNENDYLSFGARIGDNIIRLYNADFSFGVNSGTLRYNVPMGSVHRFYHGATNTAWIDDTGRLKATTFEGSGASLTNVPYASITSVPDFLLKTGGTLTGTLNGTTINATTALQEAGVNLTSKYLQLAGGNMTANANITLSGTGTFTGIHSGSGSGLTALTYGNITGVPDFLLKSGGTMTGLLTTANIDCGGGIAINGATAFHNPSSIAEPVNLTNTYINFKGAGAGNDWCYLRQIGENEAIKLAFDFHDDNNDARFCIRQIASAGNNPDNIVEVFKVDNGNTTMTGTCTATSFSGSGANLTNLPLSAYSTTGNDGSYVLKSGSTMTGNLTVNADLILKNGVWHKSIDGIYRFYYGSNDVSYYCCGGGLADGHIFMDSSYNHIFKIKNNRDIEVTGTLNILTTTAITPLFIKSTAVNSINNIELKNNANNSCYIGIGGTGYSGNYANNLFLQSPNTLILNTGGIGTGGTPKMIIDINGNVGIGIATPQSLLHIKGTNTALTIMSQGGTGATSQLNLSTYDHITNLSPCSLIATDNGTFGSSFQIKQKTSGANSNAQFTSLSIDASGNSTFIGTLTAPTINATSNFNINSVNINNFLFNNNGVLHEANQNFNNVGKYGYTFIHGLGSAPLNGPGTGDTQYYSWYIGLGSEYPALFGTVGSYGMQFAIGRTDTNPKLCIRRNQNNSWTAWQGITAEQATTATTATSLTSGDKTISGSLTVNGNLTVQDGYAINFGSSGADGRIYRTGGQVYIEGDDYIYFKSNFNTGTSGYFNQGTLYASSALQSGGSLSVGTNASISGTLSGAVNVSRRAQFTFTPTQVLIGSLGLRYIFNINLNNYITGINSSVSGINRVFRITIWGESGDFGDSTANVETMQFLIFMSFFGGINGGKRRIYQIINDSNGSTISYSNAETVYYNGWNGTGGAAQKFCIIENIAGY